MTWTLLSSRSVVSVTTSVVLVARVVVRSRISVVPMVAVPLGSLIVVGTGGVMLGESTFFFFCFLFGLLVDGVLPFGGWSWIDMRLTLFG